MLNPNLQPPRVLLNELVTTIPLAFKRPIYLLAFDLIKASEFILTCKDHFENVSNQTDKYLLSLLAVH